LALALKEKLRSEKPAGSCALPPPVVDAVTPRLALAVGLPGGSSVGVDESHATNAVVVASAATIDNLIKHSPVRVIDGGPRT
jgi:hypothetical protein